MATPMSNFHHQRRTTVTSKRKPRTSIARRLAEKIDEAPFLVIVEEVLFNHPSLRDSDLKASDFDRETLASLRPRFRFLCHGTPPSDYFGVARHWKSAAILTENIEFETSHIRDLRQFSST